MTPCTQFRVDIQDSGNKLSLQVTVLYVTVTAIRNQLSELKHPAQYKINVTNTYYIWHLM